MATAAVCDKGIMSNANTDTLLSRSRYIDSLHNLPFHSRHDRWSASLNVSGGPDRSARNVVNRSLIMPISTGSHSLLTSTATLPSVLETESHARLASYNPSASTSTLSRSLRPQPHPSAVPTSNGAYRPSYMSDSPNSSPSTTTSTLNSAITETSPVSSPQSPSSLLHSPLRHQKDRSSNGLETDAAQTGMEHLRLEDASPVRPSTSMSDSAALRKGRQMKNMKNLSINTNGISARQNIDDKSDKNDPPRPATQAGPAAPFKPGNLPAVSESAPVSPSFIIPKMPPRRKPSKLGLTISTPDTDQKAVIPPTPSFGASFAARHGSAPAPLQSIPQTPAFPPALTLQRSAPSSDNVLSPSLGPPGGMSFPSVTGRELRTPALAPHGGMTLPPFGSVDSSPSKRSSSGGDNYAPFSLQKQRSTESMDNSEIVNHTISYTNSIPASDRPLSQEVKSPSYPEGPICIYPPNVFLYHQPTAEEARDFDVIINVAREVTNPFEIEAEEEKARRHAKNTEPVQPPRPSYRSVGVQVELLTEDYPPRNSSSGQVPDSAASEISFHDVLERLAITTEEEAPPTPKASRPQPEYIHLPWEHNSKVYEEWYEICKLIDERVKQGKRVLIHCQLGVSRSASLIVAYGIYQNPNLRPDEAREQAKGRSRWIDLNMHFMYELGDFKKLLQQKGVNGAQLPRATAGHSAKGALTLAGLQRSKTDTAMLSPVLSMPPTPMSAVSDLSGSVALSSDESKDAHFTSEVSTPSYATFGPSSAPAQTAWDSVKQMGGHANETAPPLPPIATRTQALHSASELTRLPAPAEAPQRQPSPALKTPGFSDMPGGWAKTPADSRPTSMVFPSALSGQEANGSRPAERTPTQLSPAPSYVSSIQSTDDKPKRPASFRGLPRMPSFGSGLSSLGSFFLKRSSSTASKASRTSSPVPGETPPSYKRRTSTQAITPVFKSQTDPSPSPDLKKPPSLPSLRTMFKGSPNPHKPVLNMTLEPIPQSAVGQGPTENELAAMLSPRAQEFTPAPFMRPTTSHHAMSGLTMDQHKQAEGQNSGGRKRQSLSLEEMNALNATNAAVNHLTIAGMKRAESGASARKGRVPQPIIATEERLNGQEGTLDNSVREVMSPGAQERDPRSPPSHGVLAKEERVMPSIDDIL